MPDNLDRFQKTKVALYQVPFTPDYKNVLHFFSRVAQNEYFSKAKAYEILDFAFVSDMKSVKVNWSYDFVAQYNYISWQNPNLGFPGSKGKRFYGFITNKKMLSPDVTEIFFDIDVFQTYFLDTKLMPSFIERSHVHRWAENGYPVYNLVPEPIQKGTEHVAVKAVELVNPQTIYMAVCTDPLTDAEDDISTPYWSKSAQSTPRALHFYIFSGDTIPLNEEPFGIGGYTITQFMRWLTEKGHEYAARVLSVVRLLGCKVIPAGVQLMKGQFLKVMTDLEDADLGAVDLNFYIHKPCAPNQAKNYQFESKLLTYPYSYVEITDNQGAPTIVKNEYLEHMERIHLGSYSSISPTPKTVWFLKNPHNPAYMETYKKRYDNREIWHINDANMDIAILGHNFQEFLARKKAQTITGAAVNLTQGITAGFMGNLPGVFGAVGSIANTIASTVDIFNEPHSVKKMSNDIDFITSCGIERIFVTLKQLDYRFLNVIGDFFHMFGYGINRVEMPKIRTRTRWNYLKTIDCNIINKTLPSNNQPPYQVPQEYITKLKSILDAGVTFWHYSLDKRHVGHEYMYDYSVDNTESYTQNEHE